MPSEPVTKRVVAFVDGQNLFHAVERAFGYSFPNYDVLLLAREICKLHPDWVLRQVRFYTGIPDPHEDPKWHRFWENKTAHMGKHGVVIFTRTLRYSNVRLKLTDGTEHTISTKQEKGVDVRMTIDMIRFALRREYDVAVVFSQDQDFSEVAEEIRTISREQKRWIKIASAYPSSPTARDKRGIAKTDWIRIDRSVYDRCIDSRNTP